MIERHIYTAVGARQLNDMMAQAVERAKRVLLLAAKVVISSRQKELAETGISPERYTVMTPQMFMKRAPEADLIVVDHLSVHSGKFIERLQSIPTPVWRRSLWGSERFCPTYDELSGSTGDEVR